MLLKKPFYFARHGQTDGNIHGYNPHNHDLPLNEIGKIQVQTLRNNTSDIQFDNIVCSNTIRTQETAQIFEKDFKISPNILGGDIFQDITDRDIINMIAYINEFIDNNQNNLIVGHAPTIKYICDILPIIPVIKLNNAEIVHFFYRGSFLQYKILKFDH